jgi:DNA-binding CsgD family transcriptional regulator
MQRAVEVQRLFMRATMTAESLGQAFAGAGFGVLLVTEDCEVLFGNAKAEDFIRRRIGLAYNRRRLVANDRAANQRLRNLVREGATTALGRAEGGGTLELPREDTGRSLILHIVPIAPQRTWAILDRDIPAAAIFALDPSADLLARVRRFGTIFGLTAAETRVLAEIIGGSRIRTAARNLRVAEGTLRTHVKRILSKTGVTRQSELVRKFFETGLPEFPSGS